MGPGEGKSGRLAAEAPKPPPPDYNTRKGSGAQRPPAVIEKLDLKSPLEWDFSARPGRQIR
jgi:hypothetical protein